MARGGYRPGAGRKPNPNKPKAIAAPKLRQDVKPLTVPAEPKKSMTFDAAAWATLLPQIEELSRRYGVRKSEQTRKWELPKFPEKAIPTNPEHQLALDSELKEVISYGNATAYGSGFGAVAGEGLLFLGYTYLAELAQRPEYRVMAETIADDSTRKWIDFDITGDKKQQEEEQAKDPEGFAERMADPDERKKRVQNAGKLDRIKELKDDQLRLGVQQAFYQASRTDNFFGRSHLFLDIRTTPNLDPSPDAAEIMSDVGDASFGNETSRTKVPTGSFKGIRIIEPMWAYPILYNANDPLRADWYNPQQWYVMGKEIHQSRLLTFVGHPVPDILKPAYAFGGLALTQMVKPYVDIWLQTRQSVAEMIKAFSVMVLGTDLSQIMEPNGQAALMARIALFNIFRDNQGLFVHNKDTEEFKNVSATLSGLDHLQAQAQEHMASVSRIPLVKLTGISPSGLNATSEFEIEVYDDSIEGYQERFHQPKLQRVVNFEMLSLWGEIDPEITIRFNPLRQVSQAEKGDKLKAEAEAHEKYINMGAIAPEEVRKVIIEDEDLPYGDLDPDEVPPPPAEEGLLSGKGGKGGEQGQGGFNVEHADEGGAQDATPIAAGVIFKEPDGRVLLVRRSMQEANYKGHWALPGGTADGNETAQQCAVREVLEEIGASISPDGLKEIDKVITPNGMVYTTFLFKTREPFAAQLNPEHSAADWFHLSELPDPIHPAVHRVLTTKLDGGGTGDAGILPFQDQALGEDEAKFEEGKHPRGPDGKFTEGAGGGAAGGGPDKDGGTELKKEAPYGGLYVTTHGDDKAKNHDATVMKVIKGPVQIGIHYRRMLAQLMKEGPNFGTSPAELKLVKEKLAKSWAMAAESALKKGKQEEADKALKKAMELGFEGQAGSPAPAAKPAPTPAPAAGSAPQNYEEFKQKIDQVMKAGDGKGFSQLLKEHPEWGDKLKAENMADPAPKPEPSPAPKFELPSTFPPPTEAELNKAKKSVALQPQYIPGDKPEIAGGAPHQTAMVLIQAFNEKYAGKTLTDPKDLAQKVNSFKALTAGVNALAKAEQGDKAKVAAEAQKKAAEAAAKKVEAAKAEAKKNAEANKQIIEDLGLSEQHAEGFNALAKMMGADPHTLAVNFKKYAAEAESKGYPITGFQCALIKNYSNGGYTDVNKALRGHTWTPAQHIYASMVNQALLKMPTHKGKLYRNVDFSAEQIAKYKEGHVFQEDAFMSTSTTGGFGKGRNTQFQITSIGKRGADIKSLSNHPGENEVLFAAKTYFKVNKIETGTGKTVIHIEEWDAPL